MKKLGIKTNFFKNISLGVTSKGTAFEQKPKINELECRKLLSRFFYINQWKWKYTISNVQLKKSKGVIIVEIETTKPGLLIGKGGHFVSRLKSYLSNFFETDVRIKIIENKIWALNNLD